MQNGHRWIDIKKYTLGEIGVFLKAINDEQSDKNEEKLQETKLAWMANHLKYEDLNKQINSMTSPSKKKKVIVTPEEANRDWERLARTMKGLK